MEGKQGVLFSNLFRRPVTAVFDSPQSSSDGGSLLLKACDAALGLTESLASWLRDGRQPGKVVHGLRALLRQRVFSIACGYADGNDASRLRRDPVLKLLAGRDPEQGRDLASQPTLSRFENSIRRRDLLEAAKAFAAAVIERQRRRRRGVRQIVIDFDPTCDPTHGGQQLSLFNHFYDTACYLPLVVFLTFDNEREQYLVCAALRAGNAPAKQGMAGILKRLLPMLREAFPQARLRVRLDAGFAGPELLEAFEREGLEYVMCLAGNPTLKRAAAGLMEPVWKEYRQTGKRPQERYGDCLYGARSWKRRRRVVMQAGLALQAGRQPKANPRFVVTNVKGGARRIYQRVYCQRGEVENRIKELKAGVEMDRASCTSFYANQFRVLLSAAAYALLQELRWRARETRFARTQVEGLRLSLLKLGVWVRSSTRRVVLSLPRETPYVSEWLQIARSLGAVPT